MQSGEEPNLFEAEIMSRVTQPNNRDLKTTGLFITLAALADNEDLCHERLKALLYHWTHTTWSTLKLTKLIACVEIHPESNTMNNWHGHILAVFDRRFTATAAAKRMLCDNWEAFVLNSYGNQSIRNEWLRNEKAALSYMGKGGHWVLLEEGEVGFFDPIRTEEARAKH